ncbi:MAG TPA: hypothetical protein VLY21_04050 [Nitrososphaerales archaeon]|nr:hypothetical protein [Nitrososphaerales archaeon]
MITSDGRAYYALVSRLRKAGLPFLSMLPTDAIGDCELVLTTREESGLFEGATMALEDLDDDPGVVRGQILSRLAGGEGTLTVGVDPGLRIGMAAFYGEARLSSHTFNSKERLCSGVVRLVKKTEAARALVRIGNGNPAMAASIAARLAARLPRIVVEIVDESGTSVRNPRTKGMQRDQGAAAKIAFRKGLVFRPRG